jgi:hypothetical protein
MIGRIEQPDADPHLPILKIIFEAIRGKAETKLVWYVSLDYAIILVWQEV